MKRMNLKRRKVVEKQNICVNVMPLIVKCSDISNAISYNDYNGSFHLTRDGIIIKI